MNKRIRVFGIFLLAGITMMYLLWGIVSLQMWHSYIIFAGKLTLIIPLVIGSVSFALLMVFIVKTIKNWGTSSIDRGPTISRSVNTKLLSMVGALTTIYISLYIISGVIFRAIYKSNMLILSAILVIVGLSIFVINTVSKKRIKPVELIESVIFLVLGVYFAGVGYHNSFSHIGVVGVLSIIDALMLIILLAAKDNSEPPRLGIATNERPPSLPVIQNQAMNPEKCPNCGAKFSAGMFFCDQCGTKVR